MSKSGIFIFTKDRPKILESALSSIKYSKHSIFVVDDSTKVEHRIKNKALLNQKHHSYLGNDQFSKFLISISASLPKFSFLLRPLGCNNWNLGYARNYALLYSKSLALENVLFMDDDIKVSSLDIADLLFEALRVYKFTGAHITGLADDSVLGHIATDLEIHNERMLSGGFMAFNPNNITDYFLNIYNEDWIWLFMQLKGENYLQTTEVLQELKNPLAEFEQKIIFQEFGEVALDGILDLNNSASFDTLTDIRFWERILNERDEYLTKLMRLSQKNGFTHYCQIVEYVQKNSKYFTPFDFKSLFEKYFYNRNSFQKLFNSL